jgi:hypothetical protein
MHHMLCFEAGGVSQTQTSATAPEWGPMLQMNVWSRPDDVDDLEISDSEAEAGPHCRLSSRRTRANWITPFILDKYLS